jgi:hypothetical protein
MILDRARVPAVVIFVLVAFIVGTSGLAYSQKRPAPAQKYELTIFVDEGHGLTEATGHVFVGLSDGKTTVYKGWYSENPVLAPFAKGGGEVRNDAHLAEGGWDVKKTYPIDANGYRNALKMVDVWENQNIDWGLGEHCGDFAEIIANRAGADLDLPSTFTGINRPGLFGDYLRKHGGVERESEGSEPEDEEEQTGCPAKWTRSYAFGVRRFVNTRIAVQRGDKITIRATGAINFGFLAGPGGPQGILFNPDYNYFTDLPHGCLIARVRNTGSDDEWGYVGPGVSIVPQVNGVLELDVNDNDPDNNVGQFRVEVTLCRKR